MGGGASSERGSAEPAEGERAFGQQKPSSERLPRALLPALDPPDHLLVGTDPDRVPSAGALQLLASEQGGGIVQSHQAGIYPCRAGKNQVGGHAHPRREVRRFAATPQGAHLQGDLFRMRPVVRVMHRHEIPGEFGQRAVTGRVAALVARSPDQAEPWVRRAELGDDIGRAIGARIIHDDDLEIGPALVGDAAQGGEDASLGVVGGHDDADAGGGAGLRTGIRAAQVVERERQGGIGFGYLLPPEAAEDLVDRLKRPVGLRGPTGRGRAGGPSAGRDQRQRGVETPAAGPFLKEPARLGSPA